MSDCRTDDAAIFSVTDDDGDVSSGRAAALVAVSRNGMALLNQYLEYSHDREIVLAALSNNPRVLQELPPAVFEDMVLVMSMLKHFNQEWREFEVVLLLASQFNAALLSDRSFMLAVIGENGKSLRHAAVNLLDDCGVVLAAIKHGGSFDLASERLKRDQAVVLAAVALDGDCLQFAHSSFWASADVVRAAVAQNGLSLNSASHALRSLKDICLLAIRQNGFALQFVGARASADLDLITAALAHTDDVLQFAPAFLVQSGQIRQHLRVKIIQYSMYPSDFLETVVLGSRCVRRREESTHTRKRVETSTTTSECTLKKIDDLGPEGSVAFLMMLGEFVGLRKGATWEEIKRAAENLGNLLTVGFGKSEAEGPCALSGKGAARPIARKYSLGEMKR